MNDVNVNNKLHPNLVVTVYSNPGNSAYYLEKREVKSINGKLCLLAPVPLSDDAMKAIAKNYMMSNALSMDFGGIIAPHLLYCVNTPGNTVVLWYRAAMKKNLNFSASLGITGESTVSIPATLYLAKNKKLYVFALMDNSRPDGKTKLYKAPFFNIYADGNVCLGTAPVGNIQARTFELEAERYERGFYMAEQNGGQSRDHCKTPLEKLWRRLIENPQPFPSKEELKQHQAHKTVADLLFNIAGYKSNFNNHGNNEEILTGEEQYEEEE